MQGRESDAESTEVVTKAMAEWAKFKSGLLKRDGMKQHDRVRC